MTDNIITLKDDYTFLISNKTGDVIVNSLDGHGMYFRDMRYLSGLELKVDGQSPQALGYNTDYNIAAAFHLSTGINTEILSGSETVPPEWRINAHAISFTRRRFIQRGLIERLEIVSYHHEPITLALSLRMVADFADIFEVRGFERTLQGHAAAINVLDEGCVIEFRATSTTTLDQPDAPQLLRFECDLPPARYEHNTFTSALNQLNVPDITLYYTLSLLPQQPVIINLRLLPEPERAAGSGHVANFAAEVARMRATFSDWRKACTQFETDNYLLARTLDTSSLDLRSLMQQEPQGLVVTAGLPWYFTLFGRDSLITALQALSLNPQIAVDTLRTLAAYQANSFDDWRDSEPGKILHELRRGAMTLNGEMPHGPYYGSVDSTLLFIQCFAETIKWLDDSSLFNELWPAVEKALAWAEKYGERDGYIQFARRSQRGILHQGWKDSDESMGGARGARPTAPLARVEVQGYYYAALTTLAETLRRFANPERLQLADRLEAKAQKLKENFNRDFWWEAEGFLAQALDGNKQPVYNVTSNPGHCLWSGIVAEDKAARVAQRLMQPDMLSGWGVRTMSTFDPTYNPMSYHNGSIWPHDNSLLIAGLRRYGFEAEALRVADQILEAATAFADCRLPELYCGFARRDDDNTSKASPVAYPVSCSPQAWAAGTAFLLVQSLLGLQADAGLRTLTVAPLLPSGVDNLTLHNLKIGSGRVSLSFQRDPQTSGVTFSQAQSASDNLEVITVTPLKV